MSKIAEDLRRARVASEKLNEETDRLTSVLVQIGVALYELNLGVSAWVEFTHDRLLGFSRLGSRWDLVVKKGDETPQPLTNCSRQTRVEAVDYLEPLLNQLFANVEQETARVDETVAKAEAFLLDVREMRK